MFSQNWPLRGPSQQDITTPVSDIHNFSNTLPTTPEKPPNFPLTRITRRYTDTFSDTPLSKQDSKFRAIFWPGVAICIPIALLSATLLSLVFAYHVKSEPSIFQAGYGADNSTGTHSNYILVNFSATRLVFAASFLSTVAPLLGTFIMALWSLIVSAKLREASSHSQFEQLPTPYQLSLIVGICLASVQQLKDYLWYGIRRTPKTQLPPVLNQAAAIFTFSIALAIGVFVADTALHYLTSTIVFDHISSALHAERASGYGLSQMCLDLDRVGVNGGFPCSMNIGLDFEDPDRTSKRNEMARLQSNASAISEIRLTGATDFGNGSIAIMIPNPDTLPDSDDYRASTIGVGASCQLVPPSDCGMTIFGNGDTYTQFNCSENFFGVLGKSPNISASNGEKSIDTDLSPLGFKPAINLQWAFFTNSSLSTIWNPESWDPETNQPDMEHIIPDDQLINPFYLGTAARVTTNSFTTTSDILTSERNIFNTSLNGYVDLIMSCSVTSYSVNYSWYKSAIHNVTVEPSRNGSLLELFHGTQSYSTATGGGFDMQQYLINAAIAGNDTTAFLNTWGNLYSVKVLSLIGAYLTPRTNLEEQTRETMLVAKVPTAALGALIAFSLIYTVLGIILVITAYRASSNKVSLIAEQLNLAGLTNMAFGEKSVPASSIVTPASGNDSRTRLYEDDYFTRLPRRETRRVRISGTDFRVWV